MVTDIAELTFPKICQHPVTDVLEDNIIKIEVIGRISRSKMDIPNFWLTSSIEINEKKLFLSQILIEVENNLLENVFTEFSGLIFGLSFIKSNSG